MKNKEKRSAYKAILLSWQFNSSQPLPKDLEEVLPEHYKLLMKNQNKEENEE